MIHSGVSNGDVRDSNSKKSQKKKKKDLEAVLDNTMEIEKLCNFKQRELILLIA